MKPHHLLFLFSILLLNGLQAGEATAITFDGQPVLPPGAQWCRDTYEEQGFVVRNALGGCVSPPVGGVVRNTGGLAFYPSNGSTYAQVVAEGILVITRADGGRFDVFGMDVSEYSTVFPFPVMVLCVGHKANGHIVTEIIETDGIIDGTLPGADFETFLFHEKFKHLTRLDVSPIGERYSAGLSLDNLIVRVRH